MFTHILMIMLQDKDMVCTLVLNIPVAKGHLQYKTIGERVNTSHKGVKLPYTSTFNSALYSGVSGVMNKEQESTNVNHHYCVH